MSVRGISFREFRQGPIYKVLVKCDPTSNFYLTRVPICPVNILINYLSKVWSLDVRFPLSVEAIGWGWKKWSVKIQRSPLLDRSDLVTTVLSNSLFREIVSYTEVGNLLNPNSLGF